MDPQTVQEALSSNLIEDLGLQSLPDDRKLAILNSTANLVGLRLMTRVGTLLSEADRSEFGKLMEDNAPNLTEWLESRGVKFDEILIEEIARVKQELKEKADRVH